MQLTEEQVMLQQLVSDITDKYDRSYWLDCARDHRFPRELFKALADAGLLGLEVPEEFGGAGRGMTEVALVLEGLGKAGVSVLQMFLTMFTRQILLQHGTEEQKRRYIPPAVAGDEITCFATTEPEAGTNTFRNRTFARRRDDGTYLLNGQKIFISAADEADHMVVVCRTSPYNPEGKERYKGISLLIIDPRSPGVDMTPMNIGITMPERQFVVNFTDVEVPAGALLGKEGEGLACLFAGLNAERLLAAAMAVGSGEFALAKAVEYSKVRAPFGTPIGAYQALHHRMAWARAHLDAARLMVYEAAEHYDRGEDVGRFANEAKLLASHAAMDAVETAIQVHGGSAFDLDADVVPLWATQRLLMVAPINNEMVLNYIGEHVLGLPRSY